jgi:hypothetical protein
MKQLDNPIVPMECPPRYRIALAQYLVDHIFVYRCDQNLPHKINDV